MRAIPELYPVFSRAVNIPFLWLFNNGLKTDFQLNRLE